MIPQELIEKALSLTGKTIEDMREISGVIYQIEELTYRFSYPKFYAYLLSHEFTEEYYYKADMSSEFHPRFDIPNLFGKAIYEHQKWNVQPLIDLLFNL